ncbi:MAG: hypothetical protein E7622_02495 [Ruminococcaceae bacterium]|nr:hypothetical protein [Oscillospiraceae bacterium]
MKKKILSIILAIMLLVPTVSMLATVSAAEELTVENYADTKFESELEKLSKMELYAENDKMEFYVMPLSGEIAIRNKQTSEIIISNPYDVSNSGIVASKQQYLSTLMITFRGISAGTSVSYYSFGDSAIHNQMTIAPNLDANGNKIGAKVTYEFGKKELLLPMAILEEDLNRIFDEMRLIDEKEAESAIKTIKRLYAYSEPNKLYKLKPTTVKNMEALAKLFTWGGYTFERMHEDYAKVGFDNLTGVLNYGTLVNDHIGTTFEPYLKATLVYTLTDDGFNVSLDAGAIEYDATKYVIEDVGVLPYFNAAYRGQDKGYSFLPDGSGTLIRYEDLYASGTNDNITVGMYGPDYAYYTVSVKNQEQTTFPVFGNVITSRPVTSGFFAIIEAGDALASAVSRNDSYFNSIYSSFKISASDKYDLADSFSGGASSSKVISVNGVSRYTGEIDVKYTMLNPDTKYDTSYVGMANYYRDYLIANGSIDKLQESELDEYTKIFLEVFGSLKVEEKFLTFPVTVNKELTTFADIIKMHKELSNIGVDNMSFILTGFANGGLEAEYPTYLKWQKVLGGVDGYVELMKYAEENGVEIAPNVNFAYSNGVKNFSGFQYKKTGAKALDGRYTTKREYDASIQMFQRKGGVVISTDSYDLAYTKFIKSASAFNIKSLATRTLGSDLNSDFDEKTGYIFREQSKANTMALLSKLSGKKLEAPSANPTYNLILDAGNAYSLPYASSLTNVALDSSRFLNTSEAVPFTGIVLHGSIEFAGAPINMEGDDQYMFLKALENGAGLYFTVAMQNTELLKGTKEYNQYYSVQFSVWRDEIAKTYKKYNDVMASKQGSYIVDHKFLNAEDGYTVIRTEDIIDNPNVEPEGLNNSRVVSVLYENGEGFLLNYNSFEVKTTFNGVEYTIPALGFASYEIN